MASIPGVSIINKVIDWVTTPYTIYLVLKDPAVPAAKWRAVIGLILIFVYVVSPFDIIPDFVPLSGWLDDLLVVPLGFAALRKVTPGVGVAEKQDSARKNVRKVVFWTIFAVVAAVLLGLAGFVTLIYLIVRLIAG